MAQRRMLSRRISHSKKVNRLPLKAQLVWTWTIPYLDDFGCYTGDSEDIKTEVFPKNKKISQNDIEQALEKMAESGLIVWYRIGDSQLVQQYQNFDTFQTFKTDRERKSDYPHYQPENGGCLPVGNQEIPCVSLKLSKVKLNKVKRREVNYTFEFGNFWKLFKGRWNPDKGRYDKGGKLEAFEEWEMLTEDQQAKAVRAAPLTGSKITKDACRWLKKRRWEDFEEALLPKAPIKPKSSPPEDITPPTSEQRERLRKEFRKIGSLSTDTDSASPKEIAKRKAALRNLAISEQKTKKDE